MAYKFLVGFFLISLSAMAAQTNAPENWAGRLDTKNSCGVASLQAKCTDGNSVVAPGCSIACKENQIAECHQGLVYPVTCRFIEAQCSCRN